MTERYALYFAPAPNTALAAFGRSWLGRDAETGTVWPPPDLPELDAETWRAQTAAPRFYGFHGTLKPPFALAPGTDRDALMRAVEACAAHRAPFAVPGLVLQRLGRFLALVPAVPCPVLDQLAGDCVRTFDGFRAPPGTEELAKRRAGGLTERQEAHLQHWGYPHVFEDFRFHLTLTGPIADDAARVRFRSVLAPLVAPFADLPIAVDAVCVFAQPDRATPFRLYRRVMFGA